ncbi:MAG TPA: DUF883 C-terminal domain-containing protein [Sedimentisphaerales bacterium]|jgi:ElaB/YqjD/DUF883 family membrane-anchored ribosome-binding protein
MGISNSVADGNGETTAESNSTGFGNVKNSIADAIHKAADALGKKAADQDAQSGMAQYAKQASEWLDQSAEYVRQYDYKHTDAKVREYVRQNPGRSLLIAGAVGLIIGAIWRRR